MDGSKPLDLSMEPVKPAPAEVPLKQVEKPVPITVPEKNPAKNPRSRKTLWSSLIVVAIIVLGLLAWQFHVYQRLHDLYNTTSVTVKVKEDAQFALAGVQVTVNGSTYKTDDTGKIDIARIVAGSYPILLSKDGYTPVTSTLAVHRGDNDIQLFSLSKLPTKLYTLHGVVQDYATTSAVVNVQVSLNGQSTATNPAGEFSFDKLTPADYTVTLSKAGYLDVQQKITLTADTSAATIIPLVPAGAAVFVSNRDAGQRAVYAANYDGTNQHKLVTPAAGTEDFAPSLSPDGKWVVFASTRDNLKTTYGTAAAKLYIVGIDGKNLQKVSDDISANTVVWAPDSSSFYYEGYSDLAVTQYVHHFYTLSTHTVFDLGEGSNVTYNQAGSVVAYTTTASGQVTLHTLTLATGQRKDIVTKAANYFQNLVFTSKDSIITYDAFIDPTLHHFQVNFVGNMDTEVTTAAATVRTYYPSPDGTQKLFVETRDGKRDLYLIDASGQEKRLTTDGIVHPSLAPHWDASGRYATVAYAQTGNTSLYLVGIAGGTPKKIADYFDDTASPYTY